ncbi:outer membrane beta-barrel protein [Solitalea sp. MAHUQ-68]|uniref:Outer membrane beta-barrel protein n=1 Tax=Solitalea agri TaxID=2953739 RepID=A0A9X2JCF0_9SPHI|nr:outer membrane beta-barrel family protein [Solitalea agri]MCO4292464.1 outer membrane beta-barrel protein [Solitalea agri]
MNDFLRTVRMLYNKQTNFLSLKAYDFIRVRVLSTLLFSLAFFNAALAQNNLKFSGTIEDCATKKPLANASIEFLSNTPGSKPMIGNSDQLGRFTITVPKNAVAIAVNLLGYEEFIADIKSLKQLSVKADTAFIENICLKAKTNELKEITVVGKKDLLELKNDRIVYDVKRDPKAAANNLQFLMSMQPFFSISPEGKLMYKDRVGNYLVYVDGRPSGLARYDPNAFLQLTQGRTVDHIEIITSPSAKYEMGGASIIIDVKTIKIENGYTVNLNTNADSFGGRSLGLSGLVRTGKWGFNFLSGLMKMANPSEYRNGFSNDYLNKTIVINTSKNENSNRSFNNSFAVSYELDKRHLFNVGASITKMSSLTNGLTTNNMFNAENVFLYNYTNNRNFKNDRDRYSIDADYLYTFKSDTLKKTSASLSGAYRYSDEESADLGTYLISGRAISSGQKTVQNGKDGEHTLQFDYSYTNKSKKEYTIETGLKFISRGNDEHQLYYPQNELSYFASIPTNTSDFDYDQQVYSGYLNFAKNYNKLKVSIGSRAEWNNTKGLPTSLDQHYQSFSSSYVYLMPVMNLFYLVNRSNRFSFSYKSDIQKPGSGLVNPNITVMNDRQIQYGNINLTPERKHVLNTDYAFMGKNGLNLNFTLSYEFCNNALERFSWMDADSITNTTWYNSATYQRIPLLIGVRKSFLDGKLSFSLSAMLMKTWFNNRLSELKSDALYSSFSGTLNYSFAKGPILYTRFSYDGSNTTLQNKMGSMFRNSMGLSHSFLNKKLGVSLSVTSPFQSRLITETNSYGLNFESYSSSVKENRQFSITLNYRFGKTSVPQRRNTKKINNDDLRN